MATRPWVPTDNTATKRWYDFSDASARSPSAGPLSQVNDKSGQGSHATQTVSANQPAVATAALNGLDGIRVGASGFQFLKYANIAGASAAEVFYVMRRAVDAPPDPTAGPVLAGSSNQGNYEHEPYGDKTVYVGYYSTARKTVGAPTTPFFVNPHVFNVRSAANDWRYTIDATDFYTTTSNVFNAGVSPKVATPQIGGYDTGFYFNGWIFEFIVVDKLLSTAERQQYEGYLAWKWGTQANLPANHPYKAAAPTVTTANPVTARRRPLILMAS